MCKGCQEFQWSAELEPRRADLSKSERTSWLLIYPVSGTPEGSAGWLSAGLIMLGVIILLWLRH